MTTHDRTTTWRQRIPILRGALSSVREAVASDAPMLCELLTDPVVTTHISAPPSSVAAFEGFIAWATNERAAGRNVCFGIVPHGLERAVGIIQVRALEPQFETAEWGFALGAAFWSTGIFCEAAELAIQFAFDTIGVHRLEARAVSDNARANAALQKLGAVPEAVLSRAFVTDRACNNDQVLWSLNAVDWRPRRTHGRERLSAEQARAAVRRAIASLDAGAWAARSSSADAGIPHPFFVTEQAARRCPRCGGAMCGASCPACAS